MSLSYVHKYNLVSYLVLLLVVNIVADISMDYYFGNDEPLRAASSIVLEDCGPEEFRYRCYQKCGANHACFSDQCFCISVNVSSREDEDEEMAEEESPENEPESVESLEESPQSEDDNVGAEIFYDYEEDDQDPSSQESKIDLSEESEQPALRHHIAHFCPNLDIARQCIRKCMQVGLPAFCGKDHVCYCSHRYETVRQDPKGDPEAIRNAFRDLYQKYFGAQKSD